MGEADKQKGLYQKFDTIIRRDGQSNPGMKHENCDYFVLDMHHDPFALPAMEAYITACESEYPILAKELREEMKKWRVHAQKGG